MCAAGITPTSPGYRTFRVHPRPKPLRRLAAQVDSAAGLIGVRIERDERGLRLEATVPVGANAVIALPPALGAIAAVNGKGFRAKSRVDGATLDRGVAPLVEFAVGPGEWVVEAVFAVR